MNVNPIRRRRIAPNILFSVNHPPKVRTLNQWLWSRQTHHLIDALLFNTVAAVWRNPLAAAPSEETSTTFSFSSTSDQWNFGWLWQSIREDFPTKESLYAAICDRRGQIVKTKEKWRGAIENSKRIDSFFEILERLSIEETASGSYRIQSDCLALIEEGISGSYFLSDSDGCKRFVVKPVDEDIGCLNNGKGFSTPYTHSPVRDNMPLYLSAMREAAAYEISVTIGADNIVPHTVLAILDSEAFHDQIDNISFEEREQYERLAGAGRISEKLCSVQEYVPDSKTLFEGLQELQQLGLSDEEIARRIDQRDFEKAIILLWVFYDTDGHGNNFLIYPKSADAVGHEVLGVKKIDNGLTFPEKNEGLRNNLAYLPNASRKLSEEGKSKIAAISIDDLAEKLNQFGLNGSADALRQRLLLLKELAQRDDLSIKEINQLMAGIGQKKTIESTLSS